MTRSKRQPAGPVCSPDCPHHRYPDRMRVYHPTAEQRQARARRNGVRIWPW
ncbi:hypothetical protein [Phycicoccus sp.]|uniref:hypothetical protein n=1 Tax=Phycicoccus sp. TaxID=1902410 RepID=UPI002CE0F029|nr:hypothetical protein [Phycicoccus sp.]HMM95329.1 hypothetical protein [Phycicoccus sp.]